MDSTNANASAPSFQPVVMQGLSRDELPHLARLLSHIEHNIPFDSAKFEFIFCAALDVVSILIHGTGNITNNGMNNRS